MKLGGGDGVAPGVLSAGAWLEEVRLGRRRRAVAGTALAALEVALGPPTLRRTGRTQAPLAA